MADDEGSAGVSPADGSETASAPDQNFSEGRARSQPGRQPKSATVRWLVLLAGIALFSPAYLHIGNTLISQRNNAVPQILGGDQKHNIKTAVESVGDVFPRRTDGVVNPLWPWLALWLVQEDHRVSPPDEVSDDDRSLFDRGRKFALVITLAFLCLFAVGLVHSGFTLPAVFNILLLGGLGALLPRCAFFQPEPVYYILLFLSWICALALIKKPRVPLYFVFGLLLGATYLAKSSIQPILAAFFAVTAYQFGRDCLAGHRAKKRSSNGGTGWKPWPHLVGLVLVAAGFALVAGPRLGFAKDRYGSMFHSYPGYWMWMDHFEDAYEWMGEHRDAASLVAIPPDEKPSLSNYWKSHSGSQMWHRLTDGFWLKTSEFFYSKPARRDKVPRRPWESVLEFRGLYLLYLALLLSAVAIAVRYARQSPANQGAAALPETGAMLIFVLGTFALSALAYGWYSPVGRGERFMLSLYLPLAYSLIAGADHLFRAVRNRFAKPWFSLAYHGAQLAVTAFLTWRVIEILTWPHFSP